MNREFTFNPDEIGYWSEIKLQIVKDYAASYSKILNSENQRKWNLVPVYIDAFSGAGVHISKQTKELIPGSPMNAMNVTPPFHEFYFIDLDRNKAQYLRDAVGERRNVQIFEGDCNKILLGEIFPRVQYGDFKRGLCLLDPYGLHLDWQVMEGAGKSKSIEIFLNFPVMDMNMNALWNNPEGLSEQGISRMTRFWGDESWREMAFQPKAQLTLNLFGSPAKPSLEKVVGNREIVAAFQKRLQEKAHFKYVPTPIPMRNTLGAEVYYLFFASNNEAGSRIAKHIFKKYENWGVPQ